MLQPNQSQSNHQFASDYFEVYRDMLDTIESTDLGPYEPDNELEQALLDRAFECYRQALDYEQQRLEKMLDPDYSQQLVQDYTYLTQQQGLPDHPALFNLFKDQWLSAYNGPEGYAELTETGWELGRSSLELYLEVKQDRKDFLQSLRDLAKLADFEIDENNSEDLTATELVSNWLEQDSSADE